MATQFDNITQIQSYLSTVSDPKKEVKRQLKLVQDRIQESLKEESRWYLAMASLLSPSAISPKNGSVRQLIEHLTFIPEEQVVNFLRHLPSASLMEKILVLYNLAVEKENETGSRSGQD